MWLWTCINIPEGGYGGPWGVTECANPAGGGAGTGCGVGCWGFTGYGGLIGGGGPPTWWAVTVTAVAGCPSKTLDLTEKLIIKQILRSRYCKCFRNLRNILKYWKQVRSYSK